MMRVISESLQAVDVSVEVATEIAFHLTDCVENYQEILEIYDSGAGMSQKRVNSIIFTFLAHAPNHLAAARDLAGMAHLAAGFDGPATSAENFSQQEPP